MISLSKTAGFQLVSAVLGQLKLKPKSLVSHLTLLPTNYPACHHYPTYPIGGVS